MVQMNQSYELAFLIQMQDGLLLFPHPLSGIYHSAAVCKYIFTFSSTFEIIYGDFSQVRFFFFFLFLFDRISRYDSCWEAPTAGLGLAIYANRTTTTTTPGYPNTGNTKAMNR